MSEFKNTTNQKPEDNQDLENPSSKKPLLNSYVLLFLGAGLIIALDQWTKNLVVQNIPFLGTWLPKSLEFLEPYARIVHWRNSGAAFGIFQNGNPIFITLAILASIFIVVYFPKIEKSEWPLRVAMVLQLGGAIGNLIDRLRFSFVIDFVSVMDFPVFNVADSSITVGVVVLIIGIIIEEVKENKQKSEISTIESSTNPEESQL